MAGWWHQSVMFSITYGPNSSSQNGVMVIKAFGVTIAPSKCHWHEKFITVSAFSDKTITRQTSWIHKFLGRCNPFHSLKFPIPTYTIFTTLWTIWSSRLLTGNQRNLKLSAKQYTPSNIMSASVELSHMIQCENYKKIFAGQFQYQLLLGSFKSNSF